MSARHAMDCHTIAGAGTFYDYDIFLKTLLCSSLHIQVVVYCECEEFHKILIKKSQLFFNSLGGTTHV